MGRPLKYAESKQRRSDRVIATQTQTQRRAAAKKAAATRKRNAARTSSRRTATSARRTRTSAERTARQARTTARSGARSAAKRAGAESTRLEAFVRQAERALTVPVGAALVARENIAEAARPLTSRARLQRELRKLERRGETALRRSQRRAKRQGRETRRDVERGVNGFQSDTEDLVGRVQERVKARS